MSGELFFFFISLKSFVKSNKNESPVLYHFLSSEIDRRHLGPLVI